MEVVVYSNPSLEVVNAYVTEERESSAQDRHPYRHDPR
jgi:hypothetical protein